MKKIITLVSVIAFAVAANAKTSAELSAEYIAAVNGGMDSWNASVSVYQDNAADVAALFETWKGTNAAKFSETDEINKAMTAEQKQENSRMRHLFTQYLLSHSDKFATTPVRTALLMCPSRCVAAYGVGNPNFYEELKAAGFVVDGVKLPGYAICNLAKSVQDFDYIKSLSPAEGMEGPEIYFACVFDDILDMSDATAAKAKITEIINFLAKKKLFESKYMAQAKAVNSIITARLVDGKILGK